MTVASLRCVHPVLAQSCGVQDGEVKSAQLAVNRQMTPFVWLKTVELIACAPKGNKKSTNLSRVKMGSIIENITKYGST